MPDWAHEFPCSGVIEEWHRHRGHGHVRDPKTGQSYLVSLKGNQGKPLPGGSSLEGLSVRFRIRSTYQPVDWVPEEKTVAATMPSPPDRASPPPAAFIKGKSPGDGIRTYLQQRGVVDVYHFTQETNLSAILKHGLLPRNLLQQRGIAFVSNDTMRLDNAQEATSVSISFPNYKMFYRLRQNDTSVRWIVLSIQPEILWTANCAFCKTNAASNSVRFRDRRARATLEALQDMFADYPGKHRGDIPDSYPTSPQAEVLVFDPIPVSMIRSVCVPTDHDLHRVLAQAGRIECVVKPGVFDKRRDWALWPAQPNMAW